MDSWDSKKVGEEEAESITAWNIDMKNQCGNSRETRILKILMNDTYLLGLTNLCSL